MAAAARPNQADARTPCPLCGGLVHPLAGRCKHCKGELGNIRGAAPSAASALPPLQKAAAPVALAPVAPSPSAYDPYARPQSNGNPYAPTPAGYAPSHGGPVHAPAAQPPVLPPRPTGRQYVARRPTGWWKSWPVIVIVLAALAIVAAVVLMVWPPGGTKDQGNKSNGNVPAPDRTPTNPLPRDRSSRADPKPPSKADPKPPIVIPDDPDPDPDPDPATGWGPPTPPVGPPLVPPDPAKILSTMADNIHYHACERLKKCATADDNAYKLVCPARSKAPTPFPHCAAASRCIEKLAKLPCDTDVADWMSIATDNSDCMNALHC